MSDPRLEQTVFIGNVAIHQPIGSPAAPANAAVRSMAQAWHSFTLQAADIRNSSRGPLEQGKAIEVAAGPAASATASAARTITQAHARVAARAAVPAIAPWSTGAAGYWEVASGLELAKTFKAMTVSERAVTLAAVRADPAEHRDWIAALLNAPRALSGISSAEHAGLGVTAQRGLDTANFEMLSTEMEQINSAMSAAKRALDVGAAAGANRRAVTELPEIAEMMRAEPLAWPAERPDDAQRRAA